MNSWGTCSSNGLPPTASDNNTLTCWIKWAQGTQTHSTLIAFALVSVWSSLDKFWCSAIVLCYATLEPSSKQLHSKVIHRLSHYMSVVMSSTLRGTVDCNQYNISTTKVSVRYKTLLSKTFVVETLYYCNLLCYVKCSTSLLTFEAVAMSLYHIIEPLYFASDKQCVFACTCMYKRYLPVVEGMDCFVCRVPVKE